MMAGKLRSKLTLKTLKLINRISGLILIGFGIALLWGVIFYHPPKKNEMHLSGFVRPRSVGSALQVINNRLS